MYMIPSEESKEVCKEKKNGEYPSETDTTLWIQPPPKPRQHAKRKSSENATDSAGVGANMAELLERGDFGGISFAFVRN